MFSQWTTNGPIWPPLTFPPEIMLPMVDYDFENKTYAVYPDMPYQGFMFNYKINEAPDEMDFREVIEATSCTTQKIQFFMRVAHIEAPYTAVLNMSDGTLKTLAGTYRTACHLPVKAPEMEPGTSIEETDYIYHSLANCDTTAVMGCVVDTTQPQTTEFSEEAVKCSPPKEESS